MAAADTPEEPRQFRRTQTVLGGLGMVLLTALTWTERGAFLDDFEGNEAPWLRREGTAIMLDRLPGYLNSGGPS